MKPLNLLLVLFLALSSCTSKLKLAGQEHALVFKKWQALSDYAGDTFSQMPISMVARLVLIQENDNKEFVLQDLQLTDIESVFQINLRTPKFKDKYICNKECLYLNEYFNLDTQNSTILSRYYEKYEFSLFEFYSAIFSLKKSILSMKKISNEHFDDYLFWIIKTGKKFNNIMDFTDYMRQSFSVQAYSNFLQNPDALYSQLLTPDIEQENLLFMASKNQTPKEMQIFSTGQRETPEEMRIFSAGQNEISEEFLEIHYQKDSTPSEMNKWSAKKIASNEETLVFTLGDENAPLEMVNWKNTPNLPTQNTTTLALNPNLNFDFKIGIRPDAGDTVCNIQASTFGQVVGVIGSELKVSMIGRLNIIMDGIVSEKLTGQSFTSPLPIQYSKNSGIQSFRADEIILCDINL